MDEEAVERLREQLIQQIMNLPMNQDSDDSDTFGQAGDNDSSTSYRDSKVDDEDNGDEDDEDLYYDDDDDDGDVGPEDDEFEWYDWPDQSKLDALMGLPDVVEQQKEEELVDDGTQISLDYTRNPALGSDQEDDDEENVILGGDPAAAAATPGQEAASGPVKKKKKKKKKKKNIPQADDDEVEDPTEDKEVVDAEAAKIYTPTMSADDRFRLAMDNYRKERIFNAMTSQIISTYFTFGGMDVNQVAALNSSDKEFEVEVDIVYLVSAFLSSFLISSSGWYDAEYFITAPKVICGFLRYLFHKRVIPEHDAELIQAIEIAQRAKIEAPKCQKFNSMFPDSFNDTCSILYVRDFKYDILPDDSLECMEQVAGIQVATDVELRGKEIRHMRVVSIEPLKLSSSSPSPSSSINTANGAVNAAPQDESAPDNELESTEETLKKEEPKSPKIDQPGFTAHSRVTLVKLPIGWDTDNSTSSAKNAAAKGKEEEEHCTLFVASELANYLDIGTVLWGTFYTLSNGIVFARPLGAHPSYFVEQDEDITDA